VAISFKVLLSPRSRTKALTGELGVPLIPSVVSAVPIPVEAGLQNGRVACGAVNANPGRARSTRAAATSGDVGCCRGGGEARAFEDGATPVGFNSGVLLDDLFKGCRAPATAPGKAPGKATIRRHGRQGGLGVQEHGEGGGGCELHVVKRKQRVEQGKLVVLTEALSLEFAECKTTIIEQ
jgi:hypothetical protein